MALSVGSMLADIACLYFSLIAAGAHVGFDVALLAAGAGAVGAIVPLLPGGLGVVEAIIPAVVHWYGPSLSAGLAAALVYRALGTFLPAGAGLVALLALRAQRPARRSAHRTVKSVSVTGVTSRAWDRAVTVVGIRHNAPSAAVSRWQHRCVLSIASGVR